MAADEPNRLTSLVLSTVASKDDSCQENTTSSGTEGKKVTTEQNIPPSRSTAAGPLTKKWFRKQFGIRQQKDHSKKDDTRQAVFHELPMTRRRSSSLPDLASMLEAANLKSAKYNCLCSLQEQNSLRGTVTKI